MCPPSPNVPDTASRSNAQQISTTIPLTDPISNKIPDLAARIFEHYVDLHSKQGDLVNLPTFGFSDIPVSAPLRLGAVCRSWRTMAWAAPALWTKLVVNLISRGHKHGPALVKEWLARTGDLPINVALRCHIDRLTPHEIRGRQRKDAEAVVNILNLYWSKLKSIDLRDVPWDLCVMLSGSDTPQPILTNLCIGGLGCDDFLLDDAHLLFCGAPQRQAPTGLSLLATIPIQLINIDWSKITFLNLDDVTRQTAFTAMSLCAGTLTTVMFQAISDESGDLDDDDDDYWLPESVITLPSLATLSFIELGSDEGFSETLFDHITAPALKTLLYTGLEKHFEMPIASIIGCIKRSGCDIKKLILHEPCIPNPDSFEDGLVPLLHAMPNLRKLDLAVSVRTSVTGVIYALGQRDPHTDRPTFLPRLRKFKCCSALTFNWNLFPMIWMATHPGGYGIGSRRFKFAEVRPTEDRIDLSVQLTLRGPPLGRNDYVPGDALLALIAVQSHIIGEVSVKREGRRQSYLEASYLHWFPMNRPEYIGLYQTAKMGGIL